MRLDHISIVKFTRMQFMEDNTLIHDFDKNNTILEGTNGSGKSSVMAELLPWPADKAFYDEGGYRLQKYSHKDSMYELLCDFRNKSPNYSFIKDGVELNPAGLISAQKELTYQHFGINQVIHDILANIEKFTDMTTGARKKLFTLFTRTNIDGVLNNYNKLNDQLNFKKLLLKNTASKYKIEEEKLLDADMHKELTEQLAVVKNDIVYLLDMRSYLSIFVKYPHSSNFEKLNTLIAERNKLLKDNFVLLSSYNKDDLQRREQEATVGLEKATMMLDLTYIRMEEVEREGKSLLSVKGESTRTLTDKIHRTRAENGEYGRSLRYVKNDDGFDELVSQFFKLYNGFEENLPNYEKNLLDDGTYAYTNERVEAAKAELGRQRYLKSAQESILISFENTANELHRIGEHVDCPKCKTSLHIASLFKEDPNRNQKLRDARDRIVAIDKEIEAIEEYLEKAGQWSHILRYFKKMSQVTFDALPFFWERVHEEKLLYDNPQGITDLINEINLEINVVKKIRENETELKVLADKLEALTFADAQTLDENEAMMKVLNQQAIEYGEDIKHYRSVLDTIARAKPCHEKLEVYSDRIEDEKDVYRNYNLSRLTSDVIAVIDDEITSLRIDELQYNKRLHQNSVVEAALESLRKEIEEIETDVKLLTLSVDELSPKNGLIAITISHFLNNLIGNINHTIAKIWSYSLKLKDMEIGKDILDYKFKVIANDRLPVPDISKGSSGIKEVIDLAFVLVVYVLLGFKDYPLILDEVGSKFDVYHTEQIVKLIASLCSDPSFSQVFIVNHKENLNFLMNMDRIKLS